MESWHRDGHNSREYSKGKGKERFFGILLGLVLMLALMLALMALVLFGLSTSFVMALKTEAWRPSSAASCRKVSASLRSYTTIAGALYILTASGSPCRDLIRILLFFC